LATHTRYPDIKRWAQSTGRRSVQLWLAAETVDALDRLCRERDVKRAALLDSLVNEAECAKRPAATSNRARRIDP